jgi:DNA-binding transcriptional ArsR family regulator
MKARAVRPRRSKPGRPGQIERVFQALGDPTRRAIVERLSGGPRSVSTLAEPLGITLTAVAQHVHVLQRAGLAKSSKSGRTRTCELDSAGLNLLETWIHHHRSLWERRLDRLGALLSEET